MRNAVAVYKVGGSLLDFPELAVRLLRLFDLDEPLKPLVIVGGGPAADLVRGWDRTHALGEERSHWLALRAMQLNQSLIADLLPNARCVATRAEALEAWSAGAIPILDCVRFLRDEEADLARHATLQQAIPTQGALQPLPHTWDVTSDSIAAWIAFRWPASELVLLKSRSLPASSSLCESGLVDAHFPKLADHLPRIRLVDLRAAHADEA